MKPVGKKTKFQVNKEKRLGKNNYSALKKSPFRVFLSESAFSVMSDYFLALKNYLQVPKAPNFQPNYGLCFRMKMA